MKKRELEFLIQIVNAIKEGEYILEKAYEKEDIKKFNEAKEFIFSALNKSDELLK